MSTMTTSYRQTFLSCTSLALLIASSVSVFAGCSQSLDDPASTQEASTTPQAISWEVPEDALRGTDVTLREHTYWVADDLLEDAIILPDRIEFLDPVEGLDVRDAGDFLLAGYGDGFWRQITRVDAIPDQNRLIWYTQDATFDDIVERGEVQLTFGGQTETRAQDLLLIPQVINICGVRGSCAGSFDISGDYSDGLTQKDNGITIDVTRGDVRFKPTFSMSLKKAASDTITEKNVSLEGDIDLDMTWEISTTGPVAFQRSFALFDQNVARSSELIRWINSNIFGFRRHIVRLDTLIDSFDNTNMTLRRMGARLEVEYQGRTRTFNNVNTSSISLLAFAGWLNQEFSDLGVKANYLHSFFVGGFKVDFKGALPSFEATVFGRRITAYPYMNVAYNVGATDAGAMNLKLVGEGYVKAGYTCKKERCTAVQPASKQLPFAAIYEGRAVSEKSKFKTRAIIKIGAHVEGIGRKRDSVEPVKLRVSSDAVVAPPECPHNFKTTLTSSATHKGTTHETERRDLIDEDATLTGAGCKIGAEETGLCMNCIEGDQACATRECGDNTFDCVYGRCVKSGEREISLFWRQVDPELDLDLYVELPTGEILSKDTDTAPGAAHVTHSSGGACENCAGQCVGSAQMICDQQMPNSQNMCPLLCQSLRVEDKKTSCTGPQLVAIDDDPPALNVCSGKPPCAAGCREICEFASDGGVREPEPVCICYGRPESKPKPDPPSCRTASSESSCQARGCTWNTQDDSYWACAGGTVTCDMLDESTCGDLNGCTWEPGAEPLTPFIERVTIDRKSLNGELRIWVVNANGEPLRDNAEFELVVFLGDGKGPQRYSGTLQESEGNKSIIVTVDPNALAVPEGIENCGMEISTEVCDGTDNDCDGAVDESDPDLNTNCGTGDPGICSSGVFTECKDGALICTPNFTPGEVSETCDGRDNDCDGTVDDGCPYDVSLTSKYRGPQRYGGGGGGSFTQECPSGKALAGFQYGLAMGDSRVGRLKFYCADVNYHSDGVLRQGNGQYLSKEGRGSIEGTFRCPSDEFLYRVQVRSGDEVDAIWGTCAKFEVVKDGSSYTLDATPGRTTPRLGGSGGGQRSPMTCSDSDNHFLVGFDGRSGHRIDRLGRQICRRTRIDRR